MKKRDILDRQTHLQNVLCPLANNNLQSKYHYYLVVEEYA